jgi:hypothetical protein
VIDHLKNPVAELEALLAEAGPRDRAWSFEPPPKRPEGAARREPSEWIEKQRRDFRETISRLDTLLQACHPVEGDASTVDSNTKLRLGAAAAIAFPDGSMTVNAMRREAAVGHLTLYRIAGKDYTTLADIEEMAQACRVQAKVHDSRSSKPKAARPSGTSATGSEPSALAALKANAQRLRESLPPTSSPSTTPAPAEAAVIQMRSK